MTGWPAVFEDRAFGWLCLAAGLVLAGIALVAGGHVERVLLLGGGAIMLVIGLIRVAWLGRRLARMPAAPAGSGAPSPASTLRAHGRGLLKFAPLFAVVAVLHAVFVGYDAGSAAVFGAILGAFGVELLAKSALIARWERRHGAVVLRVRDQLYAAHPDGHVV